MSEGTLPASTGDWTFVMDAPVLTCKVSIALSFLANSAPTVTEQARCRQQWMSAKVISRLQNLPCPRNSRFQGHIYGRHDCNKLEEEERKLVLKGRHDDCWLVVCVSEPCSCWCKFCMELRFGQIHL